MNIYINNKLKYNELKSKQKAGDYKFHSYHDNIPIDSQNSKIYNLLDYDYIAGPFRLCIIELDENYDNEKHTKKIILIGDQHKDEEIFKCGINDEKKTIYITQFCNSLFKKNPKKIFDVFIEFPFTRNIHKKNYVLTPGILERFAYAYEKCEHRSEQKKCREYLPNVRFHHVDMRFFDWDTDDETQIYTSIGIISHYFKIIIDLISIISNPAKLNHHLTFTINELNKQIQDRYTIVGLPTLNEIILYANDYKEGNIINTYDQMIKILLSKNINVEDIKNLKKYLIQLLKARRISKDISIGIDDRLYYFLINNIVDGENIDKNLLDNIWKIANNDARISRNIGVNKDLLMKNFDIDLYMPEIYKYNNKINNIIRTKKIHNINDLDALYKILLIVGASIMDIYLLGRMFKKFKVKKSEDIQQEFAKDVIIIAGDMHVKNYIKFFEKINGRKIFHEDNISKCVSNPKNILEKYYEL